MPANHHNDPTDELIAAVTCELEGAEIEFRLHEPIRKLIQAAKDLRRENAELRHRMSAVGQYADKEISDLRRQLAEVDEVLARREKLDDKSDRLSKIYFACSEAARMHKEIIKNDAEIERLKADFDAVFTKADKFGSKCDALEDQLALRDEYIRAAEEWFNVYLDGKWRGRPLTIINLEAPRAKLREAGVI